MLAPKRVKFRKWQKGRLRGPALRGATIAFGDIGLKTVEHGKLTNQQIEAARIAMMRHIKRGGKVWIRVFPDHPVTAKPLELAKEALTRAAHKLPVKTVIVVREGL